MNDLERKLERAYAALARAAKKVRELQAKLNRRRKRKTAKPKPGPGEAYDG